MKRLPCFFLTILIVLSRPALGSSQVRTIAVIGSQAPHLSSSVKTRFERSLLDSLSRAPFLAPVPQDRIEAILKKKLPQVLKNEISSAMEDYYHFRFDEAEHLLEGRDDPEALKIKALIAFSEEKISQTQSYLIRLLRADPFATLSERDFPPGLGSHLEGLKKRQMESKSEDSQDNRRGASLYYFGSDFRNWGRRLKSLQEEMGWDFILLYWIEPIGWNRKITAALFPLGSPDEVPRGGLTQAVEVTDMKNCHEASKVIVKTLFFH